MKRYIFYIILCLLPVTGFSTLKSVVTMTFTGINCGYCLYRMQHVLSELPNVERVSIYNRKLQLIIEPANQMNLLIINKIIYESGYIPGNVIITETED